MVSLYKIGCYTTANVMSRPQGLSVNALGFMVEFAMQKRSPFPLRFVNAIGRFLSGLFRIVMKLLVLAIFVGFGIFGGGFLKFSHTVTSYQVPAVTESAQGIVALTGGSDRIARALDLLADGKAERLLISGVNPSTKLDDIKSINPSRAELFACCIEVERVAEDTIGNAVETAKWVEEKGFSSIILVTSGYHMPRSLMEFRRQLPGVTIQTFPVPLNKLNKDGWWRESEPLRLMVSEYMKYVGAWSRDYIDAKRLTALRHTLWGS